ncbi:hypothetical protein F5I97DRAFT_1815609 [Phlebopus sp. FC_14]|nr:hypothetical protein F5I97DRAFT_1815609 [Phlebopus sp. FC_14]
MGVHGLTTYLRENQRVLGKTVRFPPAGADNVVTTIVVDAWSFIYELYEQSRLPWVYGGEYRAFFQCVQQVVRAWIAVGLKVYFVFDGPIPELKLPTVLTRINRANIERPLLFFRTSPTSRSTPRFLHETRLLPPLVHMSCVEALQKLSTETTAVEVHFADGEGDPYAVELAGRLGAYVVGNDSDFVILNSGRYAGNIFLDELLWTLPLSIDEAVGANEDQNGGFQTVSKTRKRSAAQHRTAWGLVPPEHEQAADLTLSATVFTPSTLAAHLKIPVTLLPLLASLVGNDFSSTHSGQQNLQSLLFERRLTLSQRLNHAANTLSGILNPSTQKRKASHPVGSVMDLIDRVVKALLIRAPSSMASGEMDNMVDRIAYAALQYAIQKYDANVFGPTSLWPTKLCALHEMGTCPLLTSFSHAAPPEQTLDAGDYSDANVTLKLGTMYARAYRSAKLDAKITNVLSTRIFLQNIFLENPDVENVGRSIGRPIRRWIYALLEDAVGLSETPEDEAATMEGSVAQADEDEEDLDELIDVIEENSSDDEDADFLAPLRGELRRLRIGDEPASPGSMTYSRNRVRPRPKYVTEYVRRGTRIAPEEVPVPALAELMYSSGFNGNVDSEATLPVQLGTTDERMALFLHVLGSNVPSVQNLPSDRLMGVLVLRWVVQTLHFRAVESGMTKDRDNERWTQREARAFLAFYLGGLSSGLMMNGGQDQDVEVPIIDRNIQLLAQVLVAIESIRLLSQTLFVSEQVPTHVGTLSGLEFHGYLTGITPLSAVPLSENIWNACTESLEHAFSPERQKKSKKVRMEPTRSAPKVANKVAKGGGQGLFGVLADQEA